MLSTHPLRRISNFLLVMRMSYLFSLYVGLVHLARPVQVLCGCGSGHCCPSFSCLCVFCLCYFSLSFLQVTFVKFCCFLCLASLLFIIILVFLGIVFGLSLCSYLINCYFAILVFLETILRLTNTSPITLSDTCAFILILKIVSETWVVELYRQSQTSPLLFPASPTFFLESFSSVCRSVSFGGSACLGKLEANSMFQACPLVMTLQGTEFYVNVCFLSSFR